MRECVIKRNCIIDIVVKPHMSVIAIVKKLFAAANIKVIDTIGNFFVEEQEKDVGADNCTISSFNDCFSDEEKEDSNLSFETEHEDNFATKRVFPCQSVSQLYKILDMFKHQITKNVNTTIVFDSICFIYDTQPFLLKNVMLKLWDLIYNNNCTVVLINHFKIKYENGQVKHFYRMNSVYENYITQRIVVESE